MLDCRANFSMGYGKKTCESCGIIDDENHRINHCPIYRNINLYDCNEKLNYDLIYSDDEREVKLIARKILSMWDLGYGINTIRMN